MMHLPERVVIEMEFGSTYKLDQFLGLLVVDDEPHTRGRIHHSDTRRPLIGGVQDSAVLDVLAGERKRGHGDDGVRLLGIGAKLSR